MLFYRLVVVSCAGCVDSACEAGQEAVPESNLRLHAEFLVVANVVLSHILLRLNQTVDEVVVLHFGYLLNRFVLTHAHADVLDVAGLEHHHGADAQSANECFFSLFCLFKL